MRHGNRAGKQADLELLGRAAKEEQNSARHPESMGEIPYARQSAQAFSLFC